MIIRPTAQQQREKSKQKQKRKPTPKIEFEKCSKRNCNNHIFSNGLCYEHYKKDIDWDYD